MANEAEARLQEAWRQLYSMFGTLMEHHVDNWPTFEGRVSFVAENIDPTYRREVEAAARAAVQTRVEALLLAAEKVSAFEAQYPLDDTAYNDDEYDHGRAVHGELRAAVAALTATEQELSDADE